MIVVFKPGAPPQGVWPMVAWKPPDRLITAVETRCEYLICSITIIKYNLKARWRARRFDPTVSI
jgi:hypothetical protein